MKKKRTLILIGAVGILLAVQTITSFAADGKWTLTDAGYTFTYSDGRKPGYLGGYRRRVVPF